MPVPVTLPAGVLHLRAGSALQTGVGELGCSEKT